MTEYTSAAAPRDHASLRYTTYTVTGIPSAVRAKMLKELQGERARVSVFETAPLFDERHGFEIDRASLLLGRQPGVPLYESHPARALEYCAFVLRVKTEILELLRRRRVPLWAAHLEGTAFFDAFPELRTMLERIEPFERDLEERISREAAAVSTARTAPAASV